MDFTFDLAEYPYQVIHRHCTTKAERWDKCHAHPGMEFIFVHQGTGQATIGQSIYQYGPGTLMYFQPFQIHRVKADFAAKNHYVRSKFLFDPYLIDHYLSGFGSLQRFFRYLWQGQLEHQLLSIPDSPPELETLFELYSRQQNSNASGPEDFALFAATFFRFIERRWDQCKQTGQSALSRHISYAEEIIQWINSHFREEFNLPELAQQLHLSTYHVSHLFKKATGGSITEYLIFRRLREACMLLKTTSLPIQEISYSIGITNISYFCKLFKRKFGMTPAQYRLLDSN
ncbi:AraC family transcriptional regulator [Lucifera butyrica]|nr:AraC family transcriptional regulator [Lucifera butyrica]